MTDTMTADPIEMFVLPDRIIRCEGDPESEFAGVWADIVQLRMGADIDALRSVAYWNDMHALMAPMVVAWNVGGKQLIDVDVPAVVTDDGTELVPAHTRKEAKYVVLPAPATAGPDILLAIQPEMKQWILGQIFASVGYRDVDPKAGKRSFGSGPSGTPAGTTDAAEETPRPSRTSSKKR